MPAPRPCRIVNAILHVSVRLLQLLAVEADDVLHAVDHPFAGLVGQLTVGELARFFNQEYNIQCNLHVIPMKGWKRRMVWEDTGLPWVPSSPHVPHGRSALYQVATGIVGELMCVSIGVGYTLPFECIAAPGLAPHKLAEALNAYNLPGVRWRPITYKPNYFMFTNQVIGGAQLYFMEPL